ncbi:unnamed protein product [Linum tenue]|uniref:Uncharacterized protein n=1 Tax=Linum tenue TaxID=586396 RepID=A0AAV0M483_9ROSI|nr:unnamed protein product [Linum tenue]
MAPATERGAGTR